jgi:hypothetical protein
MRLSPGDVLLCVTDGVPERRAFGRLLDDDGGLSSVLGECSALRSGTTAATIQRVVDVFGSGSPADDQALIVFRGRRDPPDEDRDGSHGSGNRRNPCLRCDGPSILLQLHVAGWVLMVTGVAGAFLPRRGYGWLRPRPVLNTGEGGVTMSASGRGISHGCWCPGGLITERRDAVVTDPAASDASATRLAVAGPVPPATRSRATLSSSSPRGRATALRASGANCCPAWHAHTAQQVGPKADAERAESMRHVVPRSRAVGDSTGTDAPT